MLSSFLCLFKSGQSLPFYRYRISYHNYWFDPHPVAIGNMGNNVDKPTGQSLFLVAITVLIILVVNIFTKGFIKSISILIGLVVGTAIAASMGLVDFSPPAAAPIVPCANTILLRNA